MNETKTKNDPIDGMLHKYFHAEMPNPWPAFQTPEEPNLLPLARSRWLTYSRIAVAACIAALLAGYLALAACFPRDVPSPLGSDPHRTIGSKSGPKTVQPNQ